MSSYVSHYFTCHYIGYYELTYDLLHCLTDMITRSKPARSIISVDERNTGQFSSGLWEPDDPTALSEGNLIYCDRHIISI